MLLSALLKYMPQKIDPVSSPHHSQFKLNEEEKEFDFEKR